MKMYHFRLIASFVLAIFLTSICVVLIAWACDSYKNAVEARKRNVKDAKRKVTELEDSGVLNAMTDQALKTAVATGSAGLVGGLKVGLSTGPLTKGISIPVAVGTGVGVGVVGGYLSGSVSGYINYYDDLEAAKDDLAYYETELAKAETKYYQCKNPPTTFTYTDYNGKVYKFPDKASYNEFLRNSGHSTI